MSFDGREESPHNNKSPNTLFDNNAGVAPTGPGAAAESLRAPAIKIIFSARERAFDAQ